MRNTNGPGRRKFMKLSALSMSSLALPPFYKRAKNTVAVATIQRKIKKRNVVCVGAHPGDPEFGCGGTMAKYSQAGDDVIFLYLTRGEAYDKKKSFSDAAALRTKEAEKSCSILKARPVFAEQIDGNTELNSKQNENFTQLLLSLKPDVVFTHWPIDAHTDHQVAGSLTLTTWLRSKKQFQLYFYEVNTGSETMGFTPTDYVDISAVLPLKEAAMFAHISQEPLKVYEDFFKAMQSFRGLEKGVKAAEAFVHFPAETTTMPGL
ncbi:MAG: PIG-L family deacetylase [Ginsengibacter sp.]